MSSYIILIVHSCTVCYVVLFVHHSSHNIPSIAHVLFKISQSFPNEDESFKLLMEQTTQLRTIGSSIFPSSTSSTMVIAPGSYFMRMPSQGGREALVIFPPGEQSLQDIRYMLGLPDNDNNDDEANNNPPAFPTNNIQSVKRISEMRDGGAKVSLVETTPTTAAK